MPNIDTQVNTLAARLQQVRDSGSALSVDQQGELIRLNFRGKVAQALVRLGVARQGRLGGRVVIALVGKDNFELLTQSSETRLKNSIRNVASLIKQLETQGLDDDLSAVVRQQIAKTIHHGDTTLTSTDCRALHTLIQETIIPQRLAYRHQIAETLSNGEATATLQNATFRGVALAVAALEENMEEQAMPYHETPRAITQTVSGENIQSEFSPYVSAVDLEFAAKIFGGGYYRDTLKRDVHDANKLLGEFKSAELYLRDEVASSIAELKSQRGELQQRISREGATAHPDEVADWELQLHALDRQIKDSQASAADAIQNRLADLKATLLDTLKASYQEKEAAVKAPGYQSPLEAKKAAQATEPQGRRRTILKDSPTRHVQYDSLSVASADKTDMDSGFSVDDENRAQWFAAMKTALDESVETEDSNMPYHVAKELRVRGDRDQNPATIRAINTLRAHPVFLKDGNFEALSMNINATAREFSKYPSELGDEIKHHYRAHAATYRKMAKQKLDYAKDLIEHIDNYKKGLKALAADPETRQSQLDALAAQLGDHKGYVQEYLDVFDDQRADMRVGANIGGRALTGIGEAGIDAGKLRSAAAQILSRLDKSPLFVDP